MSTRDIFSMFNENDPWLPLAQVVRQTNSPLVRRGGCCTQVRETDLDFLALVAFFFWRVGRSQATCTLPCLFAARAPWYFQFISCPKKAAIPWQERG